LPVELPPRASRYNFTLIRTRWKNY
jgi:hypothetical protein